MPHAAERLEKLRRFGGSQREVQMPVGRVAEQLTIERGHPLSSPLLPSPLLMIIPTFVRA